LKRRKEGEKKTRRKKSEKEELASYRVNANGYYANVRIYKSEKEFVPIYHVSLKRINKATLAVLDEIRERLVKEMPVAEREARDPEEIERSKREFLARVKREIRKVIPKIEKEDLNFLAGYLLNNIIGLGEIEIFLHDEHLEEVAVNSSRENIWVYHRDLGWLKTNLKVGSEEKIENYASLIGRKVGKRITILTPLMDAHLLTGDRVNATLFPISNKGNTLTIRKFKKKPITITDLYFTKTASKELLALLWQAVQYEISIIVSGGTASGKTTFLSALMSFTPPNQRLISIEDTREIQLPKFLHWVPLTTRPPSSEGTGEVTMLDLLINSLRMRPDRIVVGEIRRQREAEVLFEALHTGHSVYSTLHADTASQTVDRLTTPPINLPPSMITALPLIVVMYRQRRLGIRRAFEIAEIVPERREPSLNIIYKWLPKQDKITKINESIRLAQELTLHTGMTKEEMRRDLLEKERILTWIFKHRIDDLDMLGKIISTYYAHPEEVIKHVKENADPRKVFG